MQNEARRRFVIGAGAGLLLACSKTDETHAAAPLQGNVMEVTPPEDLMREHGVLERVLIVYDEALRRLDAKEPFPGDVVADGATIVREFVERYHEKQEEDHLFPRFRKANRLVDLVTTLDKQHERGRALTDAILKDARTPARADDVARAMRLFVRMYRPHAARETTVLFPAMREVFSARELDELGDRFEDNEHRMFGKDGFETYVARVAKLEQALGIDDLNRFTPPG